MQATVRLTANDIRQLRSTAEQIARRHSSARRFAIEIAERVNLATGAAGLNIRAITDDPDWEDTSPTARHCSTSMSMSGPASARPAILPAASRPNWMDRASQPFTPIAPRMSGAGRTCRLSFHPFDTMSEITHSNHTLGNPPCACRTSLPPDAFSSGSGPQKRRKEVMGEGPSWILRSP